jgi:hypothetical protein
MKIKHFTLWALMLAVVVAFFAFYVPGTKVSTSTGNYTGLSCLTPQVGICKSSSPRPEIIDGKEVFNSKMYLNKRGKLVIEFYKEYLNESLRLNYFEKGFYNVEIESRLNDRDLLIALGVTDTVIIIPKGRYPVRNGWGKYVVTFEDTAQEDIQNGDK